MIYRSAICLLLLACSYGNFHAQCVQGISHVITRPNDLTRTRLVGSIYFCPENTELDDDDRKELQILKEYEKRLKTHQVVFAYSGFADATKGKLSNDDLSYRRANAVKQYVESRVGLSAYVNYHGIRARSWGDRHSDPEEHIAWRRVDIFTLVLDSEGTIGAVDAIKKSREVLGEHPGEAETRLRCLLDKLLDSNVGDLYFLKTMILSASRGGIPPNRYGELCDSARERIKLAVTKSLVDAELLGRLRAIDKEILDARAFVGGTSVAGAGESLTYSQVRFAICELAKSKTHIYSCYGECE